MRALSTCRFSFAPNGNAMLTCGDLHQVGDLLHECTLHLLQGLDEGGGVTLSMLQCWLVFGQLLKGLTCGARNRNEHPTMSALYCLLSLFQINIIS